MLKFVLPDIGNKNDVLNFYVEFEKTTKPVSAISITKILSCGCTECKIGSEEKTFPQVM